MVAKIKGLIDLHPKNRLFFMGILGLFLLISIYFQSATQAIITPLFHLDGSFQTASGLFRLENHEYPGRDFYPYLGVGPIFLLYPFFSLLGGDLHASVLSAHFVTILAFLVTILIFLRLTLSRHRIYVVGLILFPLIGLVSLMVILDINVAGFNISEFARIHTIEWLAPGNSLRPIRTVIAWIAGISVFEIFRLSFPTKYKFLGTGLILGGIAFVWSNDYAVPTFIILSTFILIEAIRESNLKLYTKYFLPSAFSGYWLSGFIVTAGHPLEIIQYNLLDVSRDQFWYFGPWSRNSRILNFQDVLTQFTNENIFKHVTILFLLYFVYRKIAKPSSIESKHRILITIGLILFAGGFLSSYGGHTGPYFWPFRKWAYLMEFALLFALAYKIAPRIFNVFISKIDIRQRTLFTVSLFLSLSITLLSFLNYQNTENLTRIEGKYIYSSTLGSWIDDDYKNLLIESNGSIFEEYFGIASSLNGPNGNFRVDSVIHALGSQRKNITQTIRNSPPDIVVTTAPRMSPEWVSWNISANYYLYRELFFGYEPKIVAPTVIKWSKATSATGEGINCEISNDRIRVAVTQPSFVEISLQSTKLNSRRNFYLIRNNLNTAENAQGYLPLDPYSSQHLFPALMTRELNVLDLKSLTSSLSGTYLNSCTARIIPITKDMSRVYSVLLESNFEKATGKEFR